MLRMRLAPAMLLIVFATGCSSPAFFGLPPNSVPAPWPVTSQVQHEAADAATKLLQIAAGEEATIDAAEARSLLLILEAAAKDREALRILKRKAGEP